MYKGIINTIKLLLIVVFECIMLVVIKIKHYGNPTPNVKRSRFQSTKLRDLVRPTPIVKHSRFKSTRLRDLE